MIPNRTSTILLIFSAATLLGGAAAAAQMQPGGMGGQQTPSQTPGQQTGRPSYPGADMPGANPGNAPSVADQAFLKSILESDKAEVQLGQLAQQKSQSDDVKQFAQKMVENRTKLDDQLKPIAKQLYVSQPKGPSKKDKQLIATLQGLSGPQFDEQYIQAVVKGHQKDVQDLKAEADSAQDPGVQQAARMDAPVIEQHLQAIEQIAQAHNVQIEAKK